MPDVRTKSLSCVMSAEAGIVTIASPFYIIQQVLLQCWLAMIMSPELFDSIPLTAVLRQYRCPFLVGPLEKRH